MDFVDVTCDMDEAVNTLHDDKQRAPASKKRRETKVSEEQMAKAELWKALTTSLTQKSNDDSREKQSSSVQNQSILEHRAQLFGNLVADNLIQTDPKDLTLLKKKIMDLFFDLNLAKNDILFIILVYDYIIAITFMII